MRTLSDLTNSELIHIIIFVAPDENLQFRRVSKKWRLACKEAFILARHSEICRYSQQVLADASLPIKDGMGLSDINIPKNPRWNDIAALTGCLRRYGFEDYDPTYWQLSRMIYASMTAKFAGVISPFAVRAFIRSQSENEHNLYIKFTVRRWAAAANFGKDSEGQPVSESMFLQNTDFIPQCCLWYVLHAYCYDEYIDEMPVNWKRDLEYEFINQII